MERLCTLSNAEHILHKKLMSRWVRRTLLTISNYRLNHVDVFNFLLVPI